MKPQLKHLEVVLLFLVLMVPFSLIPSGAWGESLGKWEYIGHNLGSEGDCVIQTIDGEYALAGGIKTVSGSGSTKYLLAKFNDTGYIQWSKSYGEKLEHWGKAYCVIQTFDGGYAFAGYGALFNFAKTDSEGNIQWNKTYSKPNAQVFFGQSLLQTIDEGYMIAGYTDTSPSDWIIKTDERGTIQWNKTCGIGKADSLVKTSDRYSLAGCALSVVEADNGGYVISGSSGVVKIDVNGNLVWLKTTLSGPLVKTADGGYLLSDSNNGSGYLTKTDSEGNIEWNRIYSQISGKHGITFSLAVQAQDGGYVICGLAGREEKNLWEDAVMVLYYFAHVTKVNSKGDVQWSILYPAIGPPMPSMGNYPNSIKATNDGAYVFTGRRAGNVWLAKEGERTELQSTLSPTSSSSSPKSPSAEPTTSPTPNRPQLEPFTAITIVASAGTLIAIIGACSLVHFRRHQR